MEEVHLLYGGTDLIFANDSLGTINYHFRKMNFEEENASISDSSGSLQFYTNGVWISNSLDDTMMNGSGLNPGSFTSIWYLWGLAMPQGGLIILFPGIASKYYLFHETAEPSGTSAGYMPMQLLYSIIDMTNDSGYGEVVSKNQGADQ